MICPLRLDTLLPKQTWGSSGKQVGGVAVGDSSCNTGDTISRVAVTEMCKVCSRKQRANLCGQRAGGV